MFLFPPTQIVASASTVEKALKVTLKNTADKTAASVIGKVIAERASAVNVNAVYFPKPEGKRFHGKLKVLVDTLRGSGLSLNFSTRAHCFPTATR